MKLKRASALLGVLAVAGALTVSGCGSDDNGPSAVGAKVAGIDCGGKRTLSASGSSAQKNAMDRFIAAYQVNCDGNTLDYTSSGSGAGVNEFLGGQTDFGGSDSPLNPKNSEPQKAAVRCGSTAWDLPTVFGPIAITYNVGGLKTIVLDGPTAARIFNGAIQRWDDPALVALNRGVTLPSEPIHVIYRSDESGTTDNFQLYLSGASNGAWGKGAGKSFVGGVGEGAKGNEGTSAAVNSTEGSVTYNEWAFAKAQNLHIAQLVTSAGPDPVALTVDSAAKAISGVQVMGQGNNLLLDTSSFYRPTTVGAYPIMLATYELVCSRYTDPGTARSVKAFLSSAVSNGQYGLEQAGYVPIPDSFKTILTAAINAIS